MALVEAELGIDAQRQKLIYQGIHLSDLKKPLSSYKVAQDDVILVVQEK